MRTYILLIGSCLLLTGCFTSETIYKAKLDRRNEHVKNLLTSYSDSSGNIIIVYTRHNNKSMYKAVVPVDSILSRCKRGKLNYVNKDSNLNNLTGVFYTDDRTAPKEPERIILFHKESRLADTTGLCAAIANNAQLVEVYKGRMAVPKVHAGIYSNDHLRAKPVSFIYKPVDKKDSNALRDATYFITFEPERRKHVRLLLVPFTFVLDIITLPGQIVFAIFALKDIPPVS